MDRILAVKNSGVSLRPSYENDGPVVPPSKIAVLLQDIPGEKDSLLIWYPDLVRSIHRVSLVLVCRKHAQLQFLRTKAFKFQELCRPSLSALSWVNIGRSYKTSDYKCAIQCISPLQVCFECVTTIVYQEMLSLSATFGYRLHRFTEILWTGFYICSRGPAAPYSLQRFAAAGNKLIKWPSAQTISYQGLFLLKQINSNFFHGQVAMCM